MIRNCRDDVKREFRRAYMRFKTLPETHFDAPKADEGH